MNRVCRPSYSSSRALASAVSGPSALGTRYRALITPQTSSTERQRLRRGGIRGLRLNFETFGITDTQTAIDRFRLASKVAAEQEWHIQINTRLPIVEALAKHILSGDVTVVFDHFAQAQPALGVGQPGFAALVPCSRQAAHT